MRRLSTLWLLLALALPTLPAWADSWRPRCTAAPLTDQQLQANVARARASRTDLPAASANANVLIRRVGCHYTYLEFPQSRIPDSARVLTLNSKGAVVDVVGSTSLTCTGKTLTDAQLAEVIAQERKRGTGLPPPFAQQTTRVVRQRCLYLYFEAQEQEPSRYRVFTLDPTGELLDVSASTPQTQAPK